MLGNKNEIKPSQRMICNLVILHVNQAAKKQIFTHKADFNQYQEYKQGGELNHYEIGGR